MAAVSGKTRTLAGGRSPAATERTCSITALSWRLSLDAHCDAMRLFTTSTGTRQTTGSKISNSGLLGTLPVDVWNSISRGQRKSLVAMAT